MSVREEIWKEIEILAKSNTRKQHQTEDERLKFLEEEIRIKKEKNLKLDK